MKPIRIAVAVMLTAFCSMAFAMQPLSVVSCPMPASHPPLTQTMTDAQGVVWTVNWLWPAVWTDPSCKQSQGLAYSITNPTLSTVFRADNAAIVNGVMTLTGTGGAPQAVQKWNSAKKVFETVGGNGPPLPGSPG